MFTWIPIYEETATRLLEFKERNQELAALIRGMSDAGLKAMPVEDQGADGSRFLLQEIDPFSFLANFNRGITHDRRIRLWQFLKERWQLTAPVPEDFEGVPPANPMSSWLFPYKASRADDHIPKLWNFFDHIMSCSPDTLDSALMDRMIELPNIRLPKLTMGMFWARPSVWTSADRKNVHFALKREYATPPRDAGDYKAWNQAVISQVGSEIPQFSRDAQELSKGAGSQISDFGLVPPLNKLFADLDEANECLDFLQKIIRHLQGGGDQYDPRISVSLLPRRPLIRLNYGNWAICAFGKKGMFEIVMPKDDPLIKLSPNFSNFREPIGDQIYSVARFDREIMLDPRMWSTLEPTLDAVMGRFKEWRQSNYLNAHSAPCYRAIMDAESRQKFLTEGSEAVASSEDQPARFWLLAPGTNADQWHDFQKNGFAGMGWNETGDLSDLETVEDFREIVRTHHPDSGESKVGKMLRDFADTMQKGDIVFAKEGKSAVVGYGIVGSDYFFDSEGQPFKHRRKIDWKSSERIEMPPGIRLPIQTLCPIEHRLDLMELLSRHFGLEQAGPAVEAIYTKEDAMADLFMPEERLDAIMALLTRKKNIILQGAPGTGKTFLARRIAYLLMGIEDANRAPMVQFHQSSSYEDFIQGYRPDTKGGFTLTNGTFYTFCKEAKEDLGNPYVLIIDEINRGNLSKIFGELMLLIEPDKRDEEYGVPLAYALSREDLFHVPSNIHLIGTMNTADRSLSMVDYALRRRFAFVEAEPEFQSPGFREYLAGCAGSDALIDAIVSRMVHVNSMISNDANLGKGYRIGHSFFVPNEDQEIDEAWFHDVVRYEILPLLEEYWIDDRPAMDSARALLAQPIGK